MISFKTFLNEAIPLSTYRNAMHIPQRKGATRKEFHNIYGTSTINKIESTYKERYKEWFKGKWRVIIPLDSSIVSEIYSEVETFLSTKGYSISDWKNGLAKSKTSNKEIRIGKFLSKENKEILLKDFNERFKGKKSDISENYSIVISRHPYDLIGQSYDREWNSCKNLIDGANKHYIPTEINKGCLIAYLIKNENTTKSKDILKNPISRYLIVPYVNEGNPNDTFLYVSDSVYGRYVEGFKENVQKWLDNFQIIPTGIYCLNTKHIYQDSNPKTIVKIDLSNLSNKNFETYNEQQKIVNMYYKYSYDQQLIIAEKLNEYILSVSKLENLCLNDYFITNHVIFPDTVEHISNLFKIYLTNENTNKNYLYIIVDELKFSDRIVKVVKFELNIFYDFNILILLLEDEYYKFFTMLKNAITKKQLANKDIIVFDDDINILLKDKIEENNSLIEQTNVIELDLKSHKFMVPINWLDFDDVSIFSSAEQFCRKFELDGFSDWRIPTLEEMVMIFDNKKQFRHLPNYLFWTSSETLFSPPEIYVIDSRHGILSFKKEKLACVVPVRSV